MKTPMKHLLVILILAGLAAVSGSSCKNDPSESPAEEYSADVAYSWIKMQGRMLAGTPGILPHVAGRTYAYVGLTLYESIVPGMRGYQSIAPQLSGELVLPASIPDEKHYWPASANAAVAFILRSLLPHASPALLKEIDSLEASYNSKFQGVSDEESLQRSAEFGRQIAEAIFEWSKSDGGHEAYKSPISEDYVPPTGPGKWVATGEFPFSEPVYPHWGNNRTFIPGLAESTQPPPPPDYSEEPGSPFRVAVAEIYEMSQHLTHEDSMTAKFWAYELLDPDDLREHEDVSHAASIATQRMKDKDFSLGEAAELYCKHGIAGNEAGISCVRTKFNYNLVRPITYIRSVLGNDSWRPVIPTPPFPEYTSGHAVVSSAYATVLEDAFGENFKFTDRTFEKTYGPRSFDSFEAYASEAALSRLKGGIHYRFAMDEGLKQGRNVAEMVTALKFRE